MNILLTVLWIVFTRKKLIHIVKRNACWSIFVMLLYIVLSKRVRLVCVKFTAVLQFVGVVYTVFLGSIHCGCVCTDRFGVEPRKFICQSLANQYGPYVPRNVSSQYYVHTSWMYVCYIRSVLCYLLRTRSAVRQYIFWSVLSAKFYRKSSCREEVKNEVCRCNVTLQK
jgi:hypothetical protein